MTRDKKQDTASQGEKMDLYFSVDIETTGLIPVKHSILSLGAAAIRGDEIVSTFEVNIKQQPGTVFQEAENGMDGNLDFWAKFPEAYAATQINQVNVTDAF